MLESPSPCGRDLGRGFSKWFASTDCNLFILQPTPNPLRKGGGLHFKGLRLEIVKGRLVSKSPLDKHRSATPDDIAVFVDSRCSVVVVVVIVKGIKDIFHACGDDTHIFV